jgi:hypothetical protein
VWPELFLLEWLISSNRRDNGRAQNQGFILFGSWASPLAAELHAWTGARNARSFFYPAYSWHGI